MKLSKLREEVFMANIGLVDAGLVVLTWGNASGIDRNEGWVVIKPSGVSYDTMTPNDLVIVDLDGNVVEGTMRPSSDLPTHLALYRSWPEVGGIVHTHSFYGTAYAQAGSPIPCFGTTHADFCPGDIPCIRALTRDEVEAAYEDNTGASVVEHYQKNGLNPLEYPGAVLSHHGPFTWGRDAMKAAENAVILESVAKIAFLAQRINPGMTPIPDYIVNKHYTRKHGPDAYYGQKG